MRELACIYIPQNMPGGNTNRLFTILNSVQIESTFGEFGFVKELYTLRSLFLAGT